MIINADDFGLSPSVNQGILEAYEMGSVSSATMMVNLPGFQGAVEMSRATPNLGVGLHFNLTYGSPISAPEEVPSLVNDRGEFSRKPDRWKKRDVWFELKKQWNQLLENHITPTHLDSHQHIQIFPAVYESMVRLAREENVPMRKVGWEPTITGVVHPKSSDRFILDVYFEDDGRTRLKQHLKSLQPGVTELMCHPGHVDEYVYQISEWTEVREKELGVFCHYKVPYWINKYGIPLIHYGNLESVSDRPR
ncbi:carbohydrate deacetylase [Alicyclobacillus dauci]|uniref:ChbG/HpnK family deacetylase n=1 Tax=Alicyclobacillus dauci TaxID=1475485 RepID=A0ABY6Z9R9_9BACL|nr:ChbG/HpnK family deacetylase [Alicyclobacillus dauci]WAH39460.1 ChbG/HpnK family deacetylase [Alicyclobacillus dauci]